GLAALSAIALILPGRTPERRAQRQRGWRIVAVVAACVPVATFLANLAPWSRSAHPAVVLYLTAAALTAILAPALLLAARRLGPRRRDRLAPLGLACVLTVAVLGLDVMTGSRLQRDSPFGLSMLASGRYYGIGNQALGLYGITALFGAAWLALRTLGRSS